MLFGSRILVFSDGQCKECGLRIARTVLYLNLELLPPVMTTRKSIYILTLQSRFMLSAKFILVTHSKCSWNKRDSISFLLKRFSFGGNLSILWWWKGFDPLAAILSNLNFIVVKKYSTDALFVHWSKKQLAEIYFRSCQSDNKELRFRDSLSLACLIKLYHMNHVVTRRLSYRVNAADHLLHWLICLIYFSRRQMILHDCILNEDVIWVRYHRHF